MLDQPVPNPLAKNPNFFTHKVFAAIGIILAGTVLVIFGLALIYHVNLADLFNTAPAVDNTPISTSSAKPNTATTSALPQNSKTFQGALFDSTFDHSIAAANQPTKAHNFSFRYPPDWTVVENDANNKNNGHFLTIGSPTGGFIITISEIPGGIGGGCESTIPPADLIVNSDKITFNQQAIYITATGSKSQNQVTKAYLDTDPTVYCMPGIVLLKDGQADINFQSEMNFPHTMTKNAFLNSSEYQTAKGILLTFKFL